MSLPVTDDIVTKFWEWTVSFIDHPTPARCRMGPLSAEKAFVCLMDPIDANPEQDPATIAGIGVPPATTQRGCNATSSQNIFIPLFVAWADQFEFPNYSDGQLARCARGEYNLGVITANVTVDGAAPQGLVNPILNRVSLSRLTADPYYTDKLAPGGSYRSGVVPANIEYLSGEFMLDVPPNSLDGLRPHGGSPEGSKLAASHGFALLLPPLSVGTHTIKYNVHVDLPPSIDGTRSALAPDIPYPFSSGDITYTLAVS